MVMNQNEKTNVVMTHGKTFPQYYQRFTPLLMLRNVFFFSFLINMPSHLFHLLFPGLPACQALGYKEGDAWFLNSGSDVEKKFKHVVMRPFLTWILHRGQELLTGPIYICLAMSGKVPGREVDDENMSRDFQINKQVENLIGKTEFWDSV